LKEKIADRVQNPPNEANNEGANSHLATADNPQKGEVKQVLRRPGLPLWSSLYLLGCVEDDSVHPSEYGSYEYFRQNFGRKMEFELQGAWEFWVIACIVQKWQRYGVTRMQHLQ
jgi:hypothetical protein